MSHSHKIRLHQLGYSLPNGQTLFHNLNAIFSNEKIGIVGPNGVGKSTLFKLIMGQLIPSEGSIAIQGTLFHLVQTYDECLLQEHLNCSEHFYDQNLFDFRTCDIPLPLCSLSGGELTRIQLIHAFHSEADCLLLDEPTNNLDRTGRETLYQAIEKWQKSILLISHDRECLNYMDRIVELTPTGFNNYGGNYTFFKNQKAHIDQIKQQNYQHAKHALKHLKQKLQITREKHEQRKAKGKTARRTGSQPKMLMDAITNRAQLTQRAMSKTSQRMLKYHEDQLAQAKGKLDSQTSFQIEFTSTYVPAHKIILELDQVSFAYDENKPAIVKDFSLVLQGPERIAIKGPNGSGKSTLLHLFNGNLFPHAGTIIRHTQRISLIDQFTRLLDPSLPLIDNFLLCNPEHTRQDAYFYLAQFGFRNTFTHKLPSALSGGERVRALLACQLMAKNPPQLLLLDEPTNHLDLNIIIQIEQALKKFLGAIIIISHDEHFLRDILIDRILEYPFYGESLVGS